MEIKEFRIGMDYVFGQVKLITGYLGGKLMDSLEDFDRVSAIELDRPLLSVLSADAALTLAVTLGKDRMRGYVMEAEGLKVELLCEDEDYATVGKLLESYISSETVARWLRIVEPESEICRSAGKYAESRLAETAARIPIPSSPARKAHRRPLPPI